MPPRTQRNAAWDEVVFAALRRLNRVPLAPAARQRVSQQPAAEDGETGPDENRHHVGSDQCVTLASGQGAATDEHRDAERQDRERQRDLRLAPALRRTVGHDHAFLTSPSDSRMPPIRVTSSAMNFL